jgi:TrmH family RNA methyltransferase
MKTIISLQNDEIKSVVKLHDNRGRQHAQQFLAEGSRTISTLLNNKTELIQLYTTETVIIEAQKLAPDNLITLISDQVLKKISPSVNPSGLVGIFKIPSSPAAPALSSGLVLAHMSDPGNVGTLIRTCAAMNIKSVVLIEGVDPYNPKVIQASAGTIAHVNIFQWSWHELLEHKGKLKLHGLIVSGGKKITTVDAKHALLVVGNEAHGLPEQWIADCDDTITIQMPGNTESLNAAVAGSIAAYEVFKIS